jgi:hypothetical protein
MNPHIQVHVLKNGSSTITFTITTEREGKPLSKATATSTGIAGSSDPIEYESVEAARVHWEYLVDHGWELDELASKQARCDHKFVDSKSCLKCGWTPPPRTTKPSCQ